MDTVAARDTRGIVLCLGGSFFLRSASAAAAELIALYLANLNMTGTPVAASLVGWVAVMFYVTELAGSPVFGGLSDRGGPRRYLRLGPVFGVAGVAIIAAGPLIAFPAILGVFIARLLQGLSAASSIPSSLSYLSIQAAGSEHRRGRIMSAFEISTIVGIASGLVIGGRLWDSMGFDAFYVVVATYLISLLLFWPIRNVMVASTQNHGILGNFRGVMRDPRALRLVPAWIAVNAVLGVWLNQQLTFQMAGHDDPTQYLVGGYNGQQIGLVGGGFSLMFVIGIGIWGLFIGRVRSTTTMVISLGGFAALCPFLFLLNHTPAEDTSRLIVVLPAATLALLVMTGFTPAALVYLSRIADEFHLERGVIMGMYSVFLGLGQFIGGSLAGYFAEWKAVDGMIILTAILGAISAIAVAGLIRHEAIQGNAVRPHDTTPLRSSVAAKDALASAGDGLSGPT
ncbi:MAG TPA: MFS transporter [Chloroflexota bacterium]|nr:MFS transporter [Chloroflexota bacterium]